MRKFAATLISNSGVFPKSSSLALALLFLSLSIQKIWSIDLWWQLRTGQWILQQGTVPARDVFSYTALGHEWIELRWLFCVLAHGGWQLGGAPLLIVAQTLILAAVFLLLAWPVRQLLSSPFVLALLSLGVIGASHRFVVRPELISFLFVVAYLVVLQRFGEAKGLTPFWLLPALQVIWVNSHTLFVLGPALVWLFAAGRWVQSLLRGKPDHASLRRFALLALLTSAACLVNPYLHRGALFPLKLFQEIQPESVTGRSIQEFRSPLGLPHWEPFLIATDMLGLVSAWTFLRRWRRLDIARLAVWAAFLYLSLLALRNAIFFALVATWASLHNLAESGGEDPASRPRSWGRAWRLSHLCLALAWLACAWFVVTDRYPRWLGSPQRFGLGVVDSLTPRAAVDFLLEARAQTQLFHDLGDGSYLIWAAAGRFPAFVDGRLEVYGDAFLTHYLQLCERRWDSVEEWNRVADAHGIRTVMLHRAGHGPLLALLRHAPEWPLVYLDGHNVVFARDIPEHAALLREHRIDLTQPWGPPQVMPDESVRGWRRWIGAVALPTHAIETAKTLLTLESPANAARWLEAGLARFPEHAGMRWALALIYRSSGREDEAQELVRGLRLGSKELARGERMLAELLRMQGRQQDAAVPLEQALGRDPENPRLRSELAAAYLRAGKWREAVAAYSEMLQRSPAEPLHWQNLGIAQEQLGDRQAAIEAYRQAVAYDPTLYRVHNQLGILLAQSGELAQAERCFEKALAVKPDYDPARLNMSRLRSSP